MSVDDLKWRRRHKAPRINGRRGAFQLLFGVVYLALSLTVVKGWPTSMAWINQYLSHWVLVATWAIPALVAFVSMFLPRPKDALSFALLAAAPIMSGFLFLIGSFVSPAISPYGLIVYWALGAAVMVVSGMTGDSDRDHREVKINGH